MESKESNYGQINSMIPPFPIACGLQLFWNRQFLRNRDVPKQPQTSGWFPKPSVTWRHLAFSVIRRNLCLTYSGVTPGVTSGVTFFGVTFSALFKINVFNDVWFLKIDNCLFITNNYCYICSL